MGSDQVFDVEAEWRTLAESDPYTRPHGYEYDPMCFYCHDDEEFHGNPATHKDTCAWVRARQHFGLPEEFEDRPYEVWDHRLAVNYRIRQRFEAELGYYPSSLAEVWEFEDPQRGPALGFRTSQGDEVFITKPAYEALMTSPAFPAERHG